MRSPWLADGYLIDLDGTLISGRLVLPGAVELLDRVRGRFVVVSNNAEHLPSWLARRLKSQGLDVPADRIVLAGATAIDLIAREMGGAAILVVGSAALARQARRRGLRPVTDTRPDVVLLARDRRFNFARLTTAANAVRAGARLVVCNPDRTHPGIDDDIVPETGALLAALLACTGPVERTVVGKPEPALFDVALARLGVTASDALMIGDNPETDGEGARRLGIAFLHLERGSLPRALAGVPGDRRQPSINGVL